MDNELFFLGAGFAFLFGLLFGSFLNVCIYRLPRGLSVVAPRSACPNCGTPIAALDNIPVLSWVLLRGRCRHCHERITPRYMAVELLTALLFAASYYHEQGLLAPTVKSCIFCFLLLGLTFTDAETHLLPDKLTLTGLAAGLIISLVIPVPGPFLAFDGPDGSTLRLALGSLANSALGAAVGSGFIFFAGWIYSCVRGVEGMGLGDVKLMALIGSFIGFGMTIFVLCLASVAGAAFGVALLWNVFRKRSRRYRRILAAADAKARAWQAANVALRGLEIPFGVFLASASLFALFFGEPLLSWYFGLFQAKSVLLP